MVKRSRNSSSGADGNCPAVQANDLCLSYIPGQRVVSNADLNVRIGEAVAITGPSGSGKSSLLYGLSGLIRPDAGVVRIAGVNLADLRDPELSAVRAQQFGFVFQFGELIPELTLLENVALPLRIVGERRGLANDAAAEVLARLGIGSLGGKRPFAVSGGQAQRAAVARAVVHRPRVVFADEPTGSLDTETGAVVLSELISLVRDFGCALILVTHAPEVAALADREIKVRDGLVTEAATTC